MNKYKKALRQERKTKWVALSLLCIPLVASAILIPIIVLRYQNQKLDYFNIFSTYDNALDNTIALGYAPDYDTTSSGGAIKYGNYLENYVNKDITQFVDIRIMDGESVDRKAIDKLKIDTIVLNEWEKSDAQKFDGIINNIAYTSMGDSPQAQYHTPMNSGGYTWTVQNSIDAGFLMLAKDYDRIYALGNTLETKANSIIKDSTKRIQYINSNNKDFISTKTIGIIQSRAKDKTKIDTEFRFYSPYVYPMIYASDETKGVGFNFPTPKDMGFINETHGYEEASSSIRGDDASQLLDQFKGKFDYLVFATSDVTYRNKNITFSDVLNSNIKILLKDPSSAEKNICFTSQGDWYTSAWGIIGKREILNKLVSFLNLKDISEDKKWQVTPPDKLKRLRYLNNG